MDSAELRAKLVEKLNEAEKDLADYDRIVASLSGLDDDSDDDESDQGDASRYEDELPDNEEEELEDEGEDEFDEDPFEVHAQALGLTEAIRLVFQVNAGPSSTRGIVRLSLIHI